MRKILTALLCSIVFVAGVNYQAIADYAATAGSGLTFGSVDLAGIKFPAFLFCDFTTAKQCASVTASNAVKVDASATTQPVSSATLATAANQATEIASLATIVTNTGAAIPAGTNAIGNLASQYPGGAVPITASATGTTGATTATLAASALIKTYICGMSIRANAAAVQTNDATVTGTVTGTLHFTQWTAPSASGLGVTEQIFNPCVPSSAINTAIAVVSGAPGTSGVVSVSAWGYQL